MCFYVGRRGPDCSLKWLFCLLTGCSVTPRHMRWWHCWRWTQANASPETPFIKITLTHLFSRNESRKQKWPALSGLSLKDGHTTHTHTITSPCPVMHVKCKLKWIRNGEETNSFMHWSLLSFLPIISPCSLKSECSLRVSNLVLSSGIKAHCKLIKK